MRSETLLFGIHRQLAPENSAMLQNNIRSFCHHVVGVLVERLELLVLVRPVEDRPRGLLAVVEPVKVALPGRLPGTNVGELMEKEGVGIEVAGEVERSRMERRTGELRVGAFRS